MRDVGPGPIGGPIGCSIAPVEQVTPETQLQLGNHPAGCWRSVALTRPLQGHAHVVAGALFDEVRSVVVPLPRGHVSSCA